MSGGFRSRSTHGDRPKKKPAAKKPAAPKPADVDVDAARRAAFDTLRRVHGDGAYANLTLPKLLRERKIRDRDAAFATEITYGTLRLTGNVDAVITECSSRPLVEIAPEALDALRLGTYQLLHTRVDAHAAVDTSVRLVDYAGLPQAKGFVNGILRTVSRTPAQAWAEKLTPQDPTAALAYTTAHPEWIVRSFAAALGDDEQLRDALAADSERPAVHLSARPGEISAEELALITGGTEGQYSPYAVYLDGGDPGQLEPVKSQLAAVQDEGSQLIARALTKAEVANDAGRWLDLCAGPGGKAALLGALARIERAHVDAVEISEHRAALIENAVRGLPVTIHRADGREPGLEEGYDRVLVDAPCSGLGALRRRPEARWRKQESDITELNELQYELLRSALRLVRPGGVVVYSTCSPDLRETRGVVDRVVGEGLAVEEDARGLVEPMTDVGAGPSVQMWPHRHGTDAMFFALLRKP